MQSWIERVALMSCEAKCMNSVAGLSTETWSGLDKHKGRPALVCAVDDQTPAWHFVEVTNLKTYARYIKVSGVIVAPSGSAVFKGPPPCTDYEWQASDTLYGFPGSDTFRCGAVQLAKVKSGRETIEARVEYQDIWNPSVKLRADMPTQPLVFKLTVK